jgi:hypothetical protein
LGSSWLKHALKQRSPITLIVVVRVFRGFKQSITDATEQPKGGRGITKTGGWHKHASRASNNERERKRERKGGVRVFECYAPGDPVRAGFARTSCYTATKRIKRNKTMIVRAAPGHMQHSVLDLGVSTHVPVRTAESKQAFSCGGGAAAQMNMCAAFSDIRSE